MYVKIDLHNHSCLSPCGDDEMTPGMLAFEAMENGIKFLGLTDHNCGKNLPAFEKVCKICNIIPVLGIEVNTVEDIHVLCFFKDLNEAMAFSSFIERLLPNILNLPRMFGNQLIMNEEEENTGIFKWNLIGTCGIGYDDLIEEVNSRSGIVIPAHIDRFANSVISSLGFLPNLSYTAVECLKIPCEYETYNNTIIQGSDAHMLDQVGSRYCMLDVKTLDFEGLRKALERGKVRYRENF